MTTYIYISRVVLWSTGRLNTCVSRPAKIDRYMSICPSVYDLCFAVEVEVSRITRFNFVNDSMLPTTLLTLHGQCGSKKKRSACGYRSGS